MKFLGTRVEQNNVLKLYFGEPFKCMRLIILFFNLTSKIIFNHIMTKVEFEMELLKEFASYKEQLDE